MSAPTLMQEYVLGFALSADASGPERLILVQKAKPDWQKGRLNGVGGKLNIGEDPVDGMVREYAEETGAQTLPDAWRCFARIEGDRWVVHVFINNQPSAAADARTTEEELIVVANPHALPETVLWNLRWLIPLALDPSVREPVHVAYT